MAENYKMKVRAKEDIVINSSYTVLKKGAIVRLDVSSEIEAPRKRLSNVGYKVFYKLTLGGISICFADRGTAYDYGLPDFDSLFEEVEGMKLTADNVCGVYDGCVCDCCRDEDECVKANGVKLNVSFYKDQLQENADNIAELCEQLPKEFLKNKGGGGWSFLNMCMRNDGHQWTGIHETMDKLLTLGIATGKLSYLLPRNMWNILPGGMPYIAVNE